MKKATLGNFLGRRIVLLGRIIYKLLKLPVFQQLASMSLAFWHSLSNYNGLKKDSMYK